MVAIIIQQFGEGVLSVFGAFYLKCFINMKYTIKIYLIVLWNILLLPILSILYVLLHFIGIYLIVKSGVQPSVIFRRIATYLNKMGI